MSLEFARPTFWDFSLTADLKPILDEVLRRVGRNLIVFQQIEHFLKVVLANHKNAGTPENYVTNLQAQTECINKKMLGHLVEKYGTDVLQDAGAEVPEEERPDDWFRFTFRISGDTEFIESMRRDLKLMTDERNDLVHHFLPRWQPHSAKTLEEALAYLDAQRDKVLPMHEHLRATVQHLQDGANKLVEFIANQEFEKQAELMWLQASPLVSLFCNVAIQQHRKDGWTYLAQAGDLAAKELPEEVKHLKERYGFKTLKKLLIGSEMFEIFDEPLVSGAFRTLYKVRCPT
jgi:hypothetical protein